LEIQTFLPRNSNLKLFILFNESLEKKMSRKQVAITYDPSTKSFGVVCEAVNASQLNQKPMEKNKQYQFKDGDKIQLLPHLYAFKIEIVSSTKRKLLEDEDSTQPADLETTTSTTTSTKHNDGEPISKKSKKENEAEMDVDKEPKLQVVAPLVQELINSKELVEKDEPNTLDESNYYYFIILLFMYSYYFHFVYF
jgi:hypothetical protein